MIPGLLQRVDLRVLVWVWLLTPLTFGHWWSRGGNNLWCTFRDFGAPLTILDWGLRLLAGFPTYFGRGCRLCSCCSRRDRRCCLRWLGCRCCFCSRRYWLCWLLSLCSSHGTFQFLCCSLKSLAIKGLDENNLQIPKQLWTLCVFPPKSLQSTKRVPNTCIQDTGIVSVSLAGGHQE